MKRFAALLLALSLLLSGCGWFRGSYVSITPHQDKGSERDEKSVFVSDYESLCLALEDMVRESSQSYVINVMDYDLSKLDKDMKRASAYIRQVYPYGAYGVEDIRWEVGTSVAVPALAVEIEYRNAGTELKNIQTVPDMDIVKSRIGSALEWYDSMLVLLVEDYQEEDLQQIAEDYSKAHPDTIMETPRITLETYPKTGTVRVLEIWFSYQNSRDDLRLMREQTGSVFASAELYVSKEDSQRTQYAQLYAFLKERFPSYQLKTSITPAYSLLRHGVGDSEAFALVYSRMCQQADLDCGVVTGSRNGEAWVWNMICCDGYYYHVDLLDMDAPGGIRLRTDAQMENYVWDYSAYPACTGEEVASREDSAVPAETEQTENAPAVPETEAPEETSPGREESSSEPATNPTENWG